MYRVLFLALPILASACTDEPATPSIGMPNPASAYCLEQGGKLENLKDADGNALNNCRLPNGRTIEEWTLFRDSHKK